MLESCGRSTCRIHTRVDCIIVEAKHRDAGASPQGPGCGDGQEIEISIRNRTEVQSEPQQKAGASDRRGNAEVWITCLNVVNHKFKYNIIDDAFGHIYLVVINLYTIIIN